MSLKSSDLLNMCSYFYILVSCASLSTTWGGGGAECRGGCCSILIPPSCHHHQSPHLGSTKVSLFSGAHLMNTSAAITASSQVATRHCLLLLYRPLPNTCVMRWPSYHLAYLHLCNNRARFTLTSAHTICLWILFSHLALQIRWKSFNGADLDYPWIFFVMLQSEGIWKILERKVQMLTFCRIMNNWK